MKQESKTILCIDGDDDTCELIKYFFEAKGFKVTTCPTAEDGVRLVRENSFGAVILDNRLKDTNGIEVCKEIRSFDSIIPIIFSSADSRKGTKEKALRAGANAYFVKPNDFDQLESITIKLIEDSQFQSL